MTKNETLDWLYRLKSNIFVFMPEDWIIPFADALDAAIKALEQEPVLDKIRAEIFEYGSIWVAYTIKDTSTKGIEKLVEDVLKQAKEQVIDVIDKYKVESEDKE